MVSGGEKTESQYSSGLRLARRVPVKVKCKVGAPEDLVKYAVKLRDRYREEFDDVWCVVDVDDFDVAPAVLLASRTRVNMAVSDPCFELWLLLHFTDHRAHVAGPEAAKKLLTKYVPNYDKGIEFAKYDPGVENAITRAAALGPDNPATGVGRLVEAVLKR